MSPMSCRDRQIQELSDVLNNVLDHATSAKFLRIIARFKLAEGGYQQQLLSAKRRIEELERAHERLLLKFWMSEIGLFGMDAELEQLKPTSLSIEDQLSSGFCSPVQTEDIDSEGPQYGFNPAPRLLSPTPFSDLCVPSEFDCSTRPSISCKRPRLTKQETSTSEGSAAPEICDGGIWDEYDPHSDRYLKAYFAFKASSEGDQSASSTCSSTNFTKRSKDKKTTAEESVQAEA